MRAEERQSYILKTAQKESFVSIGTAAAFLGVSIETVRRDINILTGKKLLRKVRGGAAPVKLPIRKDADYLLRIRQNHQEKLTISTEAAKLIRDGDVVTMDGGATTHVFASCIHGVQDVTFVVNSLHIATILLEKISAGEISGRVIMIGGELTPSNGIAADLFAAQTVEKYHFDLAFISCSSLSASGVSNSSLSGVFVQCLMQRASSCILIAESEKVGRNSVYEFAKLTDFERIIIDDRHPCPDDMIQLLENSKTELTVVSCEG